MDLQRTWRIGLTGGIGSGKSTVASMWAQRGAFIIDTDAISRSMTAASGPAMSAIAQTFGAQMVDAQGAMDRQAMRNLVFQNADAKRLLENIIHPLVHQMVAHQSQLALNQGARCLVFDVPLLVESGTQWRQQVDRIVVIDCDEDTQCQRVIQRSGLDPEEVRRIIGLQATRAQRLACADLTIFNQGLSWSDLESQVTQVATDFGL